MSTKAASFVAAGKAMNAVKTQRDVPDLYIADFGIANQVQTLRTRLTGQRGTPGYEVPVSHIMS